MRRASIQSRLQKHISGALNTGSACALSPARRSSPPGRGATCIVVLVAFVSSFALALGYRPAAAAAATSVPTVSAVSPSSGPVDGSAIPQPASIARQPGFPVSSEIAGNNSITYTAAAPGDLVILSLQLHTGGISVTGVSGGDVTNWHRALTYTNTSTDFLHFEMWWGVTSNSGLATAKVSYSGSVTSWAIELVADSYATSAAASWTLVTAAGSSNPSSTTAAWPRLESGTAAHQLYWGSSEEESSGTSSSTPSFTSTVTSHGNCLLHDGALQPTTTYAPTCGESPPDVSTTVGAIFSAGGMGTTPTPATTPGTAVTITGTNFTVGDTVDFGSTPASAVTVSSSTSITATSPAGSGTVAVTVANSTGTSTASSADSFSYSNGPPPAYAESPGFPVYASGTGAATISVAPHAIGDLVVLFVEAYATLSPTVASLSSPNIAWESSAVATDTDPTVSVHESLWAGVATSTSAATTTITYASSASGDSIELVADSFHYSGAGTWALWRSGAINGTSSVVSFPALMSGPGSAGGGGGGIYVGYSRVASSVIGGTSPGFGYYGTPRANVELRNAALADTVLYSPTASQSTSSEYSSIAAIFYVD